MSLMLELLICWFFHLSEMSWLTSPLVHHYAPLVSPSSAWSPPLPLCSHLSSPFAVWNRKRKSKNIIKLSGLNLIFFPAKTVQNWISLTGVFVYSRFFFVAKVFSTSILLTHDDTYMLQLFICPFIHYLIQSFNVILLPYFFPKELHVIWIKQ